MKVVNILFNHKKSAGDKQIAGVEQCFIDYSKLFTKNGHQVLSILKPGMPYKNSLIYTSSEIFEMNVLGNVDLIAITKLFFKILFFNPDIIICHSGRALFLARIARAFLTVPIIAINHGSNVKKFLKANYVFNVNSYFNRELIELGKPSNQCFTVPNMLEVPIGFHAPENQWHNPVRIGTLGRVAGEKNYNKAIRAVEILKSRGIEVEFWIGGDGDKRKELEDLTKELGLEKNIKFCGWISDKAAFFKEIDIFVLPSFTETFGMALLDAMLYKKPIITSDSWGPLDIVENEIDGLIVAKDNHDEMPKLIAEAFLKLINNKELAKKMAENANKKFYQKYSADVVGARILKILSSISKSKS